MSDFAIDLGNHQVKTSGRKCFPNRFTVRETLYETDRFEFQGVSYIIGEGPYETDYNKAQKEKTLVTLFAAVAMESTDVVNRVALGLPIQHYKENKDALVQMILANRAQEVMYKGQRRRIIINDVLVFPEGASAYYSLSNDLRQQIGNLDLIIVDVGGGTTDVCDFNMVDGRRRIGKYITIKEGTLAIYSDFIQAINSKYTLGKTLEDGEKIFKDGLLYRGIQQDLSFTKPVIKTHVDNIFKEINLHFDIETSAVLLVGGGSLLMEKLFRKKYNHVIVSNEPIFGNVLGFLKAGEMIWQKR